MSDKRSDEEIYLRELVKMTVKNRLELWGSIVEAKLLAKVLRMRGDIHLHGEAVDVIALLDAEREKIDELLEAAE